MMALAEIKTLHEMLTPDDARKVKALVLAVAKFDAAQDKQQAADEIARELEPEGITGISLPSLYRKAEKMRRGGPCALIDGRMLRRARAGGLASNREFVAHWHTLCADNRRKTAPAYRKLFGELVAGKSIPGVGTWRDVWASEHGGAIPPDDMACPYYPYSDTPQGWTLRNLSRLAPDKFALTAARSGLMSATMQYAPDIPRTRVGLAPCQIVQIDDMWHEVKVAYDGNRHAQRVVELGMIDVATGKFLSWLTKPVRERDDNTRETLRSEWIRYLIAHLLCNIGIPKKGCLIMGEHGTAAVSPEFSATLTEISGGRVRFGAGGMLSQPLAKGLYAGRPHGNPRYKSLIEGFHALIKNELGDTQGMVGGGRASEPETVYGMDKRDNALRMIATALEERRPGALQRMRLPYIPYADFCQLILEAYHRLNSRTWHNLEGWAECGYISGEFRTPDGHWVPVSSLDNMPDKDARAWRQLIDSGALEYRTRQMSPAEAFESRKNELQKLDPFAATVIMGTALSRPCVCSNRLKLQYKDPTTLARYDVTGIIDGLGTLTRGELYRVWINPLNASVAYIADEGGRYIGTAPVMQPTNADDLDGLKRNLGIRQRAITEEARKLHPIALQRLRRANADAAQNAREILGRDPVEDDQTATAVADQLRPFKRRADLDDLRPLPKIDTTEKLNLDDIL